MARLADERGSGVDERQWPAAAEGSASAGQAPVPRLDWPCAMAIVTLFLLGIANFAMRKAVLESGHELLGRSPWYVHMLGGRYGFGVEFLMLLGAMLMVDTGSLVWAWGYALYSAVNGLAAWLILSGRV
jgi:hypothetical protein